MTRAAAIGLALLAALAAGGSARAEGVSSLVSLLQPGARPDAGLGGDPFRSPLTDEAGWWAHPAVSGASGERLDADWSARTPGASSLDGRSLAWWESRAFATRARELRAGIGATRLDRSSWIGGDAGRVRLDASGTRLDAAGRATGVIPGLTLQAIGPLWNGAGSARPTGTGAGARFSRGPALAAQVHGAWARAPERFASNVHGEPIAASLNLASSRWQADAASRLPGALALEASVSRTWFSPLEGRSLALDYTLEPAGTAELEQASAAVGSPRRRALVRWTHARFDLDGDLRWGGDRFGRLAFASGDLHAWLAAAEHASSRTRVLAEVERGELTMAARATVESWPFTDATVDLLGLRRIGRTSASATWVRGHVAGERALGRAWRLRGGASWYDAELSGRLDSWQPTFLVFGVTDFRSDALPWRRAQLAVLSGALSWQGRAFGTDVTLQQPVFGRTFDAHGKAGGAGVTPPAGGANPGKRASLRESGTELRLTLRRSLP